MVLYCYPDVGSKTMRGNVQEDGKTWVCAEHWTAPHHNGYVEGWLKEREKLFGLIKIPAENAVIYYRDTSDWTQKKTVGCRKKQFNREDMEAHDETLYHLQK